MSDLTKLKLMRSINVEREYRIKYPALAKVAAELGGSILLDQLDNVTGMEKIYTSDKLDLSLFPVDDICILANNVVPEESMTEELEKLAGISLVVVLRMVRLSEHRFRVFYYFRQSDQQSYTMVYSAILDDTSIGLIGDIDLNDKIVLRGRGFHPGVIAISTFDNLINIINAINVKGIESYRDPVETFAFKKKVPSVAMRKTHKHYRVKSN